MKRPAVAGYLLLAFGCVLSFWRVDVALDRLDAANREDCTQTNEARALLRDLARDLVISDGQLDADDRATLALVDARLAPKDCER